MRGASRLGGQPAQLIHMLRKAVHNVLKLRYWIALSATDRHVAAFQEGSHKIDASTNLLGDPRQSDRSLKAHDPRARIGRPPHCQVMDSFEPIQHPGIRQGRPRCVI